MTWEDLMRLADEKFAELIEQDFLAGMITSEVTAFMAMMAARCATYAADEEHF